MLSKMKKAKTQQTKNKELTKLLKKMKKAVFTIGLCMIAAISFGQKKAVSEALKLAKDAKPNFTEARSLIKGALENPETKDDPKTWYTAGQIESLQFDSENTKEMIGQQANDAIRYEALIAVYPYFVKSYELDNLPDAKGKVKPKHSKDIKAIMKANLPYYMNGGAHYFEQNDFKKALDYFNQLVDIHDTPFMKEDKPANEPVDSVYIYSKYYAAIAAMQLDDDRSFAINAITRASKQDFKQNDMFQYLCQEYSEAKDTVNWEKALNEGLALFPKEEYFLFGLINIYLYTDRNEKALSYVNTAIQNNPTSTLYNAAGQIYESLNDLVKAEESFKKAVDLDTENADATYNLGRIYYNQGVVMLDEANNIADVKKYNEEKEKALVLFRKALPFFETTFKINPNGGENRMALRHVYYQLSMGDKFQEMDDLINNNSGN